MYYSAIGILSLFILVILNNEVLFKKNIGKKAYLQKSYRLFLLSIIAYYITDILWGIFDNFHLRTALFIDTELYFIAMAIGILFWTRYVDAYLHKENRFGTVLRYAGTAFFGAVGILVFINIFAPVLFRIDEKGTYVASAARYVVLIIQIILLFFSSAYALAISFKSKGSKRQRHLTIGLFGLIMLIFIFIQIFYPYLPLYAMGYLMGSCLLHTFVIGSEKASYRKELEEALKNEEKQSRELQKAWNAAYTDALTGAKSKLAFLEISDQLDKEIEDGSIKEMAIALFDVNSLKRINDTYGHDKGDEYIKKAFLIICNCFEHSPVFRTGGDEFVAVLRDRDYENRHQLQAQFNRKIENNLASGDVVISIGIADYIPGDDNSCKRILDRADALMYERKQALKTRT